MKFTIDKKALQKAMSTIGGCIERKSTIPVLQNILIESLGDNYIRLTSTDMDISKRFDAPCEIKTQGKICINGEKMLTLIPALPDGEISFTKTENDWADIKAGNSKPKIAGVSADNFPAMASAKPASVTFKGDDLRALIEQTSFAASEQVSRFTLNALKLEIADGIAKMVSTDGLRLPIAVNVVTESERIELLIPKKAALEILKMDDAEIGISEDANHIFIHGDGLLMSARKIAGSFPNYEMIIPKDNTLRASFDVGELRQAVKRCGLFATLNTIRCDLTKDVAKFYASPSDSGEIEESVTVEYDGESQSIGFNWPHLMDFLNLVGDGKMEVLFNKNPSVPAILTAENLPDYQYILVLVNIAVQQNIAQTQAEKPKTAKGKKK